MYKEEHVLGTPSVLAVAGGGAGARGRPAAMEEQPPVSDWTSEGPSGDGDPDPPPDPSPDAGRGGDDVEDPGEWRRRVKAERRARLRDRVNGIIREMRTPIRDIVEEHVLHRLPVQSLLRFASVSTDWRRLVSVPLFRHTQSHAHRSVSGVFRQVLPEVPAYYPFDPLAGGFPDPSLTFLPGYPAIAAVASSNGLLCCAGVLHSFYVCNPSTAEWTPLPEPPPPRLAYCDGAPMAEDGLTAVALVFEPSDANLDADYNLVRAFEVSKDCEGVYGFQVFSSGAGAWRLSSDVCAAERMIRGSGVSAGGAAYWRTAMQTVVAYDPAADRCWIVPWPMGYEETAVWQLGEMGGRLCCTCVTDWDVKVYALAAVDRWSLLASYRVAEEDEEEGEDGSGVCEAGRSPPTVFRSRPWPLRFQSGGSEVLMWMAGRVVGVDVASGMVREVYVAPQEPWMNPAADHVPHISTFARVFPQVPPPLEIGGVGDEGLQDDTDAPRSSHRRSVKWEW